MPKKPIDYRSQILIADGDFATEYLLRRENPPASWEAVIRDDPDVLRDVARSFVDAGAMVLTTPTDSANAVALAAGPQHAQLDAERISEFNKLSAALYRSVADGTKDRLVWGAIGPVEPLLALGEIEENALLEAYRTQARALADGGVDAILCRSFTELEALCIAVRAAKETGIAVIGSMSFDCGPDFTETTMGASVPRACEALAAEGVAVVGCDRGEYPDATPQIVALMRKSCDLAIFTGINAGQPELREYRAVYTETPKTYAERLSPVLQAGATIIGGGRGTSADHVGGLVRARDVHQRRMRRKKPSQD